MAAEKIIVIGAGVAGLATGIYARANGYDVDIFEMHNLPGGMCTAWDRKGFTFDFCIHNLVGTAPHTGLRHVWDELGALDGVGILHQDMFVRLEGPDGEKIDWFTNLGQLGAHLKTMSPGDAGAVDEMIGAARWLAGADLMSMAMGGFWRTLNPCYSR